MSCSAGYYSNDMLNDRLSSTITMRVTQTKVLADEVYVIPSFIDCYHIDSA